jgi:hypothetical protein
MNVKMVSLAAALALLASSAVCAHQPSGRSSVYATPGGAASTPGATASTPGKVEKAHPGNGRGSVYARDLPPPTPRDRVQATLFKPGRA